ncbi:MAG: hypothetical protein NZ866_00635, partial [Patescibacteria group bacterium]|nr:hypothetical protein [Patescibacteria group bacterium]
MNLKINNFHPKKYFRKYFFKLINYLLIIFLFFSLSGVFDLIDIFISHKLISKKIIENTKPKKAKAVYHYTPSGGQLITGTEIAPDANNMRGWRALLGNDSGTNGSGNYWIVQRASPGGLDVQFWFDGVELYGAN